MSSSAKLFPLSMLKHWRPKTPDMQADVLAICEKWSIPPPEFYATSKDSKSPTYTTLSEEDMKWLSVLVAGVSDPWPDLGGDPEISVAPMARPTTDNALFPPELDSQPQLDHSPSEVRPSLQSGVVVQEQPATSMVPSNEEEFTNKLHSADPPLPMCPAAYPSKHWDDSKIHGGAVLPARHQSLRHDHPHSPYPLPSTHSFYQRHFPSHTSSISERRSVIKLGYRSSVLPNVLGIGEAGHERQTSPHAGHDSADNTCRMRNGRRVRVPLKEWHPKRVAKGLETLGVIEFWSREEATGNRIRGTYLADRFKEHTGRSFLSEGDIPFPNKKEKGFHLRVLWPGYPEFSKKISIHKSLSECTLRDVRDWMFSALAEFIRVPGAAQNQTNGFWRVGEDEDTNVIHLDDIVLVRLKQVGKGTWVPELDILD